MAKSLAPSWVRLTGFPSAPARKFMKAKRRSKVGWSFDLLRINVEFDLLIPEEVTVQSHSSQIQRQLGGGRSLYPEDLLDCLRCLACVAVYVE